MQQLQAQAVLAVRSYMNGLQFSQTKPVMGEIYFCEPSERYGWEVWSNARQRVGHVPTDALHINAQMLQASGLRLLCAVTSDPMPKSAQCVYYVVGRHTPQSHFPQTQSFAPQTPRAFVPQPPTQSPFSVAPTVMDLT